MKHLFIGLIIVKGDYRNSIVNLEGKAVNTVINNDYILQISVSEYPHVFDVVAFVS